MRRGWVVVLGGLSACSNGPASPSDRADATDTPTPPEETADTAEERLLQVIDGPTYGVPADSKALLVGEVRFTTSVPSVPTLHIDGPCGRDSVRFPEATEHVLPVLGLHMGAEHQLSLGLEGAGEQLDVAVGPVTTAVLANLPPVEVHAHDPAQMEPGLLVFTPYHSDEAGWVLAVDDALHLVYALPQKVEDITLEPGGTWLANHEERVVRWDAFGRELAAWTDGEHRVHHEAFSLPDGGVLTISGEEVVEPDFPTDETLTATEEHTLLAQQILRFASDGTVVERLRLGELLDTRRVGYLSLEGADPKDWAHANSVVPWDDDSYVVSVRHLDVVAAVNRDGTLRWLLGDPTGWEAPWSEAFLTPADPSFTWFRHPHALEVQPDGLVVLFDNGNYGGSPYAPAPDGLDVVSRGLALRVDEEAGTFEQVWSLPHEGLFSPGQGDADVLPHTGNALLVFTMTGALPSRSRIVQLHPERPDEPALDVTIGGDVRRFVYRAEVVPSLYPDGWSLPPSE